MDEEISIINSNSRNDKIKNFIVNNKIKIISSIIIIIVVIISFYSFDKYKINQKKKISDDFNLATIEYSKNLKDKTINKLIDIINKKDPTYSPLSLYFVIDNKIISDQDQINSFFDILINQTPLDNEIKNLVIYKKALFNSDSINENQLLNLFKPIINSESIWKGHSLYLLAEFFYSKNEKLKSKDFFNQIINLKEVNTNLKLEAQKKLNRDF